MKSLISTIIPYLVVLAQVFLISMIILSKQKKFRFWVNKNSMNIIFIISLLATVGSLFYSKIMGYNPCELCWYQRILIYPIVIISGFSLKKSSIQIKKIILFMASFGGIIAAYQYFTQIAQSSSFCAIGATDCTSKIIFKLGYISIPLMAFTAFAIIIVAILLTNKRKQK